MVSSPNAVHRLRLTKVEFAATAFDGGVATQERLRDQLQRDLLHQALVE